MAPVERDRQFRIMMSDEEMEMVRTLADQAGLTASDIVRQLIRREYEQKAGGKPPKKRTK